MSTNILTALQTVIQTASVNRKHHGDGDGDGHGHGTCKQALRSTTFSALLCTMLKIMLRVFPVKAKVIPAEDFLDIEPLFCATVHSIKRCATVCYLLLQSLQISLSFNFPFCRKNKKMLVFFIENQISEHFSYK